MKPKPKVIMNIAIRHDRYVLSRLAIALKSGNHSKLITLNLEKDLEGRFPSNHFTSLAAVYKGLEALKMPANVTIKINSQYVIRGFSSLDEWKRNGWKTASGSPVRHARLWNRIAVLSKEHQITFKKQKSHPRLLEIIS